ncbi:MAG: bifunctional phosphopantothenoylcysteine decarboxylase/phosphopantothenate--cysteine ligase CoaBC [Gammaproteobacteria bacterium]|nr:bifunctional phosphopantothenoylcysteine decarboxylase/phosphopantothenate--cysteine ligase CoaBC [Gammaproteobacteria bacterium]
MQIIVGVSGGIAAYKSPELVRRLRDRGHDVRVVMTEGAKGFIGELSLQAVSGNPVSSSLIDPEAEAAMGHIELARWADLILIAPATANCIAKIAHGIADDLLTTLILATQASIAVAPAMNQQMWLNLATQENLNILDRRNVHIIGPAAGDQACGEVGLGRMTEPDDIAAYAETFNHLVELLKDKKVIITAGPTREAIDPVRYLSNHSSGKMGYALADAAAHAGAEVILVSGPVQLATPRGVKRINVTSAANMHDEVIQNLEGADIFIGCAAVADYRVAQPSGNKIKKTEGQLVLTMVENPDIIASVSSMADRPYCVGFAAETENHESHGRAKLKKKGLDMICINDVADKTIGFNSEHNRLTIIRSEQNLCHTIETSPKTEIAKKIIELIAQEL